MQTKWNIQSDFRHKIMLTQHCPVHVGIHALRNLIPRAHVVEIEFLRTHVVEIEFLSAHVVLSRNRIS